MPKTISIPASSRTRATSAFAGVSSVSIGSIVIAFLPRLRAARPSLHRRRSEDNVWGAGKPRWLMELSLIVRGQHRQGDDMRARLADDIDLVMRAEELGF